MAAYVAVVSLKRIVAKLLDYYDVFIPPPFLEHLKSLQEELKCLQELVERMESESRKRWNAWLGRIPKALNRFADVVTSHGGDLRFCMQLSNEVEFSIHLQNLKQDIHSFMETLKKVKEEYYHIHPQVIVSSRGGNMVGLSDLYDKLKADLVGDWIYKISFSLVGMAGIGKTTLAKEIFQDPDILEWFDCRAWVEVGREFNSKEITRAILAQVDPNKQPKRRFGRMFRYLQEYLKGKRYLVVFDDAWDKEVLDYSVKLFPNNENGSRVLLTTTKQFVASSFNVLYSPYVINMRLLNKEESWQLLCDKVFGEDSCPPHLEKAGKKIAEKCDGLPLTIITVADQLLKVEKSQESFWNEVATQKKHQLFTDAYDEISKVLYPRYDDLHDDFKLCFLYVGIFPQKYRIPKSRLLNLWIAGKLVEIGINQSIEDYLEQLTLQSLVVVFQRSTSLFPYNLKERIKTCGLHASWWHFCQREARKNNFFYVLDCYGDALGEGIKGQSRLSIHNNVLFGIKEVYNSMEENCASTAHSLLCFGPYHKYPVPMCFGLKLLRKLDALEIRFYKFPVELLELVKLRYLSLTCNGELSPFISILKELQFLIVRRHLSIKSSGDSSYLPMEIWNMENLKHLQVMGSDLPNIGDNFLRNLLTLLNVSFKSCTKCVVGRIPNLEKLGIRVELTPDAAEPLCCFDYISHLNNLKSLKCVVVNPKCKSKFVAPPAHPLPIFPSQLRKLSLNGLGYPWEEMSKIASLPSLEVLKLRCNAFRGTKWEIKKKGFKKLYSLLIEDTDLEKLKGASGSFECLRKLSIRHCYKLKELHLRHCDLLSKIEVVDCNPLVEKEIKKRLIDVYELPDHFLVQSSWKSLEAT